MEELVWKVILNKQSLKERIKNFDYIFYQIINAVKYLHDNGILHGDLKAKNILINKETKEITIIDYGACSYEHSEGFARTLCTYHVSSPEDLRSGKKNGKSSRASDIWAIGMNMIHYLHGEDIIDLLEIDTEDLQDLFKRLQVDNQGFDYPLPNEHKRKLQLGKTPKVKVEAKYRKLFLPLLMFDSSKRPNVDQLLNNPIFKPFTINKEVNEKDVEMKNNEKENENEKEMKNKEENKDEEIIDELDTEINNDDETLEIKFISEENKDKKESKKENKNVEKENKNVEKENKKDEMIVTEDETCEEDAYQLVRSDLIMYLHNVLKAYNGSYCMVHIMRVMDKYVEFVRHGKSNSQFTVDDLFKDKNISKITAMAVTILMTSLLVQWRDLFTIDQLEDILDIEQADDIIARITDILNVMKYNLYERTFDTLLSVHDKSKIDYEKLREVLKE